MKKIMVPTDFSATADKALAYALRIAERCGAEVTLLHTISLPLPAYAVRPEGIQEYNLYRAREAQELLDGYVAGFGAAFGYKLKTLLVNGNVQDAIIEKSVQYDVDLIVMGTRGADGIKELLGTNASFVVAASRIPVLVVPEHFDGAIPKKMVLAVQQEESEEILAPLFRLQAIFGADLQTLLFSSDYEPIVTYRHRESMLADVTSKWKEGFAVATLQGTHITGEDFSEALEEYIDSKGISLLAMVTHRKRGLQGLFQKSMTRERAYHTRVPLLSLHA